MQTMDERMLIDAGWFENDAGEWSHDDLQKLHGGYEYISFEDAAKEEKYSQFPTPPKESK